MSTVDPVKSYITAFSQTDSHSGATRALEKVRCAVTISRMMGARGRQIAGKLARYMNRLARRDSIPWTVFDENLVSQVLEDHHLPAAVSQFMPEDRVGELTGTLGELLGLHPNLHVLVQNTAETILKLCKLGNVIIVGRGANVVTAHLSNCIHIRLTGSQERRVAHLMRKFSWSEKEAQENIRKTDAARSRYLRTNYGKDIQDSLLYQLVVNTDSMKDLLALRLIAGLIRDRSKELNPE